MHSTVHEPEFFRRMHDHTWKLGDWIPTMWGKKGIHEYDCKPWAYLGLFDKHPQPHSRQIFLLRSGWWFRFSRLLAAKNQKARNSDGQMDAMRWYSYRYSLYPLIRLGPWIGSPRFLGVKHEVFGRYSCQEWRVFVSNIGFLWPSGCPDHQEICRNEQKLYFSKLFGQESRDFRRYRLKSFHLLWRSS